MSWFVLLLIASLWIILLLLVLPPSVLSPSTSSSTTVFPPFMSAVQRKLKFFANIVWGKATGSPLFVDPPIILNRIDSLQTKTFIDNYFAEHKELANNPAQAALEISRLLRKHTLSLHGNFISEDKESDGLVDYEAMKNSDDFKDYVNATALLTKLSLEDLSSLASDIKIAFFLNIYNSLILHSTAVLQPPDLAAKFALYSQASYAIAVNNGKDKDDDGCVLSLNDIEHGILRGNRPQPSAKGKPQFGKGDARVKLSVEEKRVDPRIHFALNCGAKSCPRIRVYSSERLDAELEMAANTFCNQEIIIKDDDTISLSKIFLWYGSDFGADDRAVLTTASKWLQPQKKEALLRILQSQQPLKIEYRNYDWSLNATSKNKHS